MYVPNEPEPRATMGDSEKQNVWDITSPLETKLNADLRGPFPVLDQEIITFSSYSMASRRCHASLSPRLVLWSSRQASLPKTKLRNSRSKTYVTSRSYDL